MDIWGVGCVFYELLTLEPIFPGDDEIDQVNKINYILGSPPEDLFEKFVKNSAHRNEFNFEYQKGVGIYRYLNHVSPDVVDLISKMLIYDPDLRPTARECLNHKCFKEFVQQEIKNAKKSQLNFYQNSILMKSFNDSISIRNDDSIQIINLNNNNTNNNYGINNYNNSKTLKTKKEASISNMSFKNANDKYNYKNILLPLIKLNNINEDSKGEDSFNNSSISKKNQDSYLRLPKISQKKSLFGGVINFMNSNEFKKLKHNISNHSLDKVISSAFTQYEKKQKINIKKRVNDVKKNYVSPYSKKIIENNLII
jgi:renal tumor antigen